MIDDGANERCILRDQSGLAAFLPVLGQPSLSYLTPFLQLVERFGSFVRVLLHVQLPILHSEHRRVECKCAPTKLGSQAECTMWYTNPMMFDLTYNIATPSTS